MSTRSVIAIQTGESWKGRYCHSDGYPSWQLRRLHELVTRDGLDTVRTTLLRTYAGWSVLHSDQPDFTDVTPDTEAEYGTPAYRAAMFAQSYSDGRFINVPGYGIAYSTATVPMPGDPNYQQVSEDDWITLEDGSDADAAWGYVLGDRDILVYENGSEGFTLVGRVGYDQQLSNDEVAALECGERFERCGHLAWVHFPEAKDTRVSTDTWLGRRAASLHEIETVLVNGERITIGGGSSGSLTQAASWRSGVKPTHWWGSVRGGGEVRMAHILASGNRLEVDAVVPTEAGEQTIPRGTVLR